VALIHADTSLGLERKCSPNVPPQSRQQLLLLEYGVEDFVRVQPTAQDEPPLNCHAYNFRLLRIVRSVCPQPLHPLLLH
jgi:hypothetical protein